MAKNISFGQGTTFYEPSVAEGVNSGDPIILGEDKAEIPAIALTDRDDDGGATVIVRDAVVVKLNVTGKDDAGNSAVARWDKLYKDGDEINKDATNGILFGYAMGTVAAGATTEIEVMLA